MKYLNHSKVLQCRCLKIATNLIHSVFYSVFEIFMCLRKYFSQDFLIDISLVFFWLQKCRYMYWKDFFLFDHSTWE